MSRIKGKALAAFFCVTLCLGGCKDSGQELELYSGELAAPEQANYVTVQAEVGEYEKNASGKASVYYPVRAELVWEEGNSRFGEILVKSGQAVKEGDVLMSFDLEASGADKEELSLKLKRLTENTAAGKAERQSAIEEANAAADGLSGHERQIALLKAEKLQAEYEAYVYQSEQQTAEYRERMAELEKKAENNTLTAPFDGVIDYVVSCSSGDAVQTNQVLIEMHAENPYYLSVDDTAGNLRYHMEVTIETGKRDAVKTYTGRVVTAGNVLGSSVPEGKVLIRLDEEVPAAELEGNLKYQCTVEKLQGVLLIDRKAVCNEEKKKYVYVLNDDMIQKRYIVLGLNQTNADRLWVVDGLSEDWNVIVD